MPPRLSYLLSALLAVTAPVLAHAAPDQASDQPRADTEAWTATPTMLRADAAGIALPRTLAGLSLSKSGELSGGGRGIDNYAQYLSDDGAIQATLYVYLPGYADAAIAAYMTDKAVMDRFGPKTRRTAYATASAGGHRGMAIRAVYDDAANGALTTAAAFVHAGRWMVKLRVTGPTERRRDVLAGLDGMLAGLHFDNPAALHAAMPASFAACPAPASPDARHSDASSPASQPNPAPPRDDPGDLCVRGTIVTADASYAMIQRTDAPTGPIIIPVDDAGRMLAFDPVDGGTGYRLSIHSVGQTDLYGVYDRIPGPRQIAAILDESSAQPDARAGDAARVTIRVAPREDR